MTPQTREQLSRTATESFKQIFAAPPQALGIAPGRVEILGNHTDYNQGFVLSAAIDRYIAVVGKRNNSGKISVYSRDFEAQVDAEFPAFKQNETEPWSNYVLGVISEFIKAGHEISGCQLSIAGDVPLGAGLSSSAALEVAVARCLARLFAIKISDKNIAFLAQRAENNFVGMNCGILDQWSSVHGREDSVILLDCRELKSEQIPLGNQPLALVLANTNARHELVDGTYNRLREGCFAATRNLALDKPGITHLRDIRVEDFESCKNKLPQDQRNLAAHIVYENQRVLDCVAALRVGDLETMGKLMFASHFSSRDNFGNSGKELDLMVELAAKLKGCYGARLSGGGFGGCTINLVAESEATSFTRSLKNAYLQASGIECEIYICKASQGATSQDL